MKVAAPAPVPIPALPFMDALRTCGEVDAFFRLREGTAKRHCDAGLIPYVRRDRAGKPNYLIAPDAAYRVWGPR